MEEQAHKRLFIGVPVDERCQQQIDAAVASLRTDKNIRWLTAHNRHLTLAFLGATSDADLLKLQAAFADAYTDLTPFDFPLAQLTRFPDTGGHILAATNDASPKLLQLYQRTRNLLDDCQITFEDQYYRPHITLGRLRQPRTLKTDFYQALTLTLHIDRINLYESVGTEQDRQYVVLMQALLSKKTRISSLSRV